jgi:hypothetical protein
MANTTLSASNGEREITLSVEVRKARYDALPAFIIENVLRTAQISRERYLELMNRL